MLRSREKENKLKLFRMIAEGSFVITASFLTALVIAGLTIHAWGWNSGNVASWVQAVGSILAIGGAYFVGERQASATLRATQEAHKLGERARREGMFSVVKAAHSFAKTIDAALADENKPLKMYGVYHPSLIDSLVDLMVKLPVSELGSDRAINAFIMFSGQFTFLKESLDRYVAGAYTDEVQAEIANLEEGYRDRWKEVVAGKWGALTHNVRVHIESINTNFATLKAALEQNTRAGGEL
jgi:hypothetical protein